MVWTYDSYTNISSLHNSTNCIICTVHNKFGLILQLIGLLLYIRVRLCGRENRGQYFLHFKRYCEWLLNNEYFKYRIQRK